MPLVLYAFFMLWRVLCLTEQNVIFFRLFRTESSWHFSVVLFLVGKICPRMQDHKSKSFNKYQGLSFYNFLQSSFWIWITKRFTLVREFDGLIKAHAIIKIKMIKLKSVLTCWTYVEKVATVTFSCIKLEIHNERDCNRHPSDGIPRTPCNK